MAGEPVRGRLPDPGLYSLAGIDQARALMRGLVPRPPLTRLAGLRLTQVGAGTATMTMPASPWLQLGDGTLDPKMLLEAALHVAVLSGAPPANEVVAASLSINHLRPCALEGESFVARGRVIHNGPTFTVAEVFMEDALGRGVAHATGAYLVRPLDPTPPPWSGLPDKGEEPVYATPDPYLRPLPEDTFLVHAYAEVDGRALVENVLKERAPSMPVLGLVGNRVVDVGEGSMASVVSASEWLCGFYPHIQPGCVAYLLHIALSGAVVTLAPAAHRTGIVDQNINFLRQVPADGRELLARGEVVHRAGPFYVSKAELTDADGNLVAVGHQNSVLVERRHATPLVERVLATVVFTDIVGSTRRAEELGDAAWQRLLADHHAAVRRQLEVWKGHEVKTLGDGFLVTFDSPGRAVHFSRAVREAVQRLGLELRVGVHTGECEVARGDLAGIAVHVAARLQANADPGEILVSGTVHGLVAGSGLRFTDRGRRELKGIEGDWPVFALEG